MEILIQIGESRFDQIFHESIEYMFIAQVNKKKNLNKKIEKQTLFWKQKY